MEAKNSCQYVSGECKLQLSFQNFAGAYKMKGSRFIPKSGKTAIFSKNNKLDSNTVTHTQKVPILDVVLLLL